MIKYLGSKKKLLPQILQAVQGPGVQSVMDVFSGTARVGHHLKKNGFRVISNDSAEYAKVIADTYVVANKETYQADVEKLVAEYNASDMRTNGYFTKTFCEDSRFFQPFNGQRVDAIRDDIELRNLDPILKNIMITSLMLAADRVDSTAGIQMAYIKKWATRSFNKLELRVPELLQDSPYGPGEAVQMDAIAFARSRSADVAYLDPPYVIQHSYAANYHIWRTLCLWDKPEAYGIACKREDTKVTKSPYNSVKTAKQTFKDLIAALNVSKIVVSFSDEGFISKLEMEDLLATRGNLKTIEMPYKRYVGAQIGIHDLNGNKVGEVSHLNNTEFLYIVDC